MPLLPEMSSALRRHWQHYLAEAAGLAFFVTCGSLFTLTLEHPASPVHQFLVAQGVSETLRRIPLGFGMGLVLVVLAYNPWGKRSGAHINPAVTLAFWQLGKINRADALWYGLAQAAGGIGAMLLLRMPLAPYYAHPRIHFITTQPGPGEAGLAFAAEFGISFGLMAVLLLALHSERLHKAVGWLLGALLMGYIIWVTPYSGMSINPFRSLAAAVAARDFSGLWVCLLAPTAAMWLVAVLFLRYYRGAHRASTDWPRRALPHYPIPAAYGGTGSSKAGPLLAGTRTVARSG